jgi:hypothetical protein
MRLTGVGVTLFPEFQVNQLWRGGLHQMFQFQPWV